MLSSPLPELLPGPPPEVLDEIGAAWERAQAPMIESLELSFKKREFSHDAPPPNGRR